MKTIIALECCICNTIMKIEKNNISSEKIKCEFKCIARNVSVVCTLKELSLNKNTSIKQIQFVVFDFIDKNSKVRLGSDPSS